MTIDITTIGGAPLSTSQSNAELVVNPNQDLLTKYSTTLDIKSSITLTASLTLTTLQMASPIWIFGGTPASAITATLQAVSFGLKIIENNCGKNITFDYGSGSTVTIATGNKAAIFGDGTNIITLPVSIPSTLAVNHLQGSSSALSLAAGSGAGTGPTVGITGTDLSGVITITTGSAPSGSNATLATITFNGAYSTIPNVLLTPCNDNAAALLGTSNCFADSASTTTTAFVVKAGSVALAPATTYKWVYTVIQ